LRRRSSRGIALIVLTLLQVACSRPDSGANSGNGAVAAGEGAGAQEHVLESFNVGDNVYVRALAVDRASSTLWVATSAGVNEIDLRSRNVENVYTRENALANEYVFAVFKSSDGSMWLGTNGGGVSRYREGKWETLFPMHGLADYWVYSFGEQSDQTVWIGTWAGASHFDPHTQQITNYVKELVNEWVYGIGIDRNDRVWFGTEGGVSMYDGKGWHAWRHADGIGAANKDNLPFSTNTGLGTRTRHDLSVLTEGRPTYNPNYVFCVLISNRDQPWVGTWGGGVSHYDGRRWQNLTTEDGLAGSIVFSMTQDAKGVFWFGTNNGLSRYDGRHWRNYSIRDGLPGRSVYAVVAAPNGDIWVGTKGGVARLGHS